MTTAVEADSKGDSPAPPRWRCPRDHARTPTAALTVAFSLAALLMPSGGVALGQVPPPAGSGVVPFEVHEASVRDIRTAIEQGRTTAQGVAAQYLARIQAYDREGPSLNSLTAPNLGVTQEGLLLDSLLARGGSMGPLHGVTVVVADNVDVFGAPTTAGSVALESAYPARDAYVVRRLRAAGALIIAKSNVSDFGLNESETAGSLLPGFTFNPYGLNRAITGSSGGVAAAVTASFGTVGIGADRRASVRGPAATTALVALRPTVGLVSRGGALMERSGLDVLAPVARSVADVAAVLDVIAGTDPQDIMTAEADGLRPVSYLPHLRADGLEGKRIGILTQLRDRGTDNDEVRELFRLAVEDLRSGGATVVEVSPFETLNQLSEAPPECTGLAADIAAYLEALEPVPAVRSVQHVLASGLFHPWIKEDLLALAAGPDASPEVGAACAAESERATLMREELEAVFRENGFDALIYPGWSNPPRILGDVDGPNGNNGRFLAPESGFPALTVPMGELENGMPMGLGLLGPAWSEPTLLELASGYEALTRHRAAPRSTPPLYIWSP